MNLEKTERTFKFIYPDVYDPNEPMPGWLRIECVMTVATVIRLESLHTRITREATVLRQQISGAFAAAGAGDGDHENWFYEQVIEKLRVVDARIARVGFALSNAVLLVPRTVTSSVWVGNSVMGCFGQAGERITVTILGSEDSATRPEEWVNFQSPFGQALLDATPQQTVTWNSMEGLRSFSVLEILPGQFGSPPSGFPSAPLQVSS